MSATNHGQGKRRFRQGGVAFGVLFFVLLILFLPSLRLEQVVFSNDSPLGVLNAQAGQPLAAFTGFWQNLNWLGAHQLSALPSITQGLYMLLGPLVWGARGPILFAKFYPVVALFILGLSAWYLARRLGWGHGVALLVAMAMMLNSDAFSHACWGLPSITLGFSATLLALAALAGTEPPGWRRLILAGFAVGMAVMESFDVGAILSLYVAAFVMFGALTGTGRTGVRVSQGLMRVALVSAAAGLLAAYALTTLVGTQVKGVSGMAQDGATRAARWREATQWSLPRVETLQLVVPGLFGYRMDTPDGGSYWGGVGRDPIWDDYLADPDPDPARAPGGGLMRHSGAGFYAGVVVVLVGVWGLVNSCRGKGNPFVRHERNHIWFWAAAAVVSLLLAYGRHAPFYQLVYQLPFFSVIRNPIKFLHPLEISLVILFGYGMQGLWRGYVEADRSLRRNFADQLRAWWRSALPAERRWTFGSLGVAVMAGFAWLVYSASTERMSGYLGRVGFGEDRELKLAIARSSAWEAGVGLIFLVAAIGLVIVLMSGALSGRRRQWAGLVMGLVLVGDLARADLPWIVYYDYREKYATNPVIELLSEEPQEHRVTGRVTPLGGMNLVNEEGKVFADLYNEWLEHLFQFYRVQSLDIIQMPRTPLLDEAYLRAFRPTNSLDFRKSGRQWELTNTRYVLGMTGFLGFLNEQFDPGRGRFRVHTAFTLAPKPGVERLERLAQLAIHPTTNGPFALFEFEGALPRARMHTRWRLVEDDSACLERLLDATFDPRAEVLVSGTNFVQAGMVPSELEGKVEFERYEAKRTVLRTQATAPSVLLLNDRWHEYWNVYVDGEKRELLRCNYLMRGVFLEPGEAIVEFRFEPPVTALYISLAAIVAGIVLLGTMILGSPATRDLKGEQANKRQGSSPGQRRNA